MWCASHRQVKPLGSVFWFLLSHRVQNSCQTLVIRSLPLSPSHTEVNSVWLNFSCVKLFRLLLGFLIEAVKASFEPVVMLLTFRAFYNSTSLSPDGNRMLVNVRIGFGVVYSVSVWTTAKICRSIQRGGCRLFQFLAGVHGRSANSLYSWSVCLIGYFFMMEYEGRLFG